MQNMDETVAQNVPAKFAATHTPEEVAAVWRAGLAAWTAFTGVGATMREPKPRMTALPATSATSAALGIAGELAVEAALREHYIVRNVASSAHSGDLHVFIEHHRICVEVKNYSRTVPATEVAKFMRDCGDIAASGGVFVSIGASIAHMPTGFSLRTEHIGGRAIPCAYLSSVEPGAAIVAVQMIADLIRQRAETIALDAQHVNEIVEHAEDLSRLRAEMIGEVGATMSTMIKIGSRLGTVAAAVHKCAHRMRDELPIASAGRDLFTRLDMLPAFRRYDVATKAAVAMIADTIMCADVSATWKLTPKRCTHESGSAFSWTVVPDVLIPRARVTGEMAADALGYGKKATLTQDHLCVEIGASTLQWICGLI